MEKKSGAKLKSLQNRNRNLVLGMLKSSSPLSIPELADSAGLSKTTLTKIINYLLKDRFVVAAGKGSSSDEGGKRPELFRFNPNRGYAIGVHIAPELITTALSDLSGHIVDSVSVVIHADESLPVVIGVICNSVRSLVTMHKISEESLIGIAIGAHGITDIEKGVSLYSPHFPSWGTNVELKRLVGETLSYKVPILVDNQIRFQVYAERSGGIARGYDNVVVIEGGEGLVAGIIRDGNIHRGRHNLAGEIGHLPLDPYDAESCGCGAHGCFELLVASRRVVRLYREELAKDSLSEDVPALPEGPVVSECRMVEFGVSDTLTDTLTDTLVSDVSITDVFARAEAGQAAARRVMDATSLWFARGIATLVLVEDPEIVVFQGIYDDAGAFFLGRIRTHLAEITIPNVQKDIRIEYSTLGHESCLVGASAFLIANYFNGLFF